MKRLLAMLLVLTLCMSFGVQAFAAGGSEDRTGKITITQAVKGAEYKAYRLFDLTYNEQNQSYSYTVTEQWKGFAAQDVISGPDGYLTAETIDDKTYITWKKEGTEAEQTAFAAEFAQLALAYAGNPQNRIVPDASAVGTVKQSDCTAEFTNLLHGYYLVDTSVGSLCMLDSTHPDFTAADKSTAPTLAKHVKEGCEWKKKNDANIGDTIEFKSIVTVGKGAENYVLKDDMGKGLDFIEVTKITLQSGADPQERIVDNAGNKNYSVITGQGASFSVRFENEYIRTLKPGDVLTVYYTAFLSEHAEIRTEKSLKNRNRAWLEYGHNTDTLTTAPSETDTRTWDFKIHKYAEHANGKKALAGASFRLHRAEENGALVNFTQTAENGTYRVCTKDDDPASHVHITEMTTGENGNLHLEGLDSGLYYLEETKAPDGYNRLKNPVEIRIGTEGEINMDTMSCGDITVRIENKSGSEMPSTGGVGTVIFYVTGTALLILAGVMLAVKKKYDAKREK